VLFDVSLLNIKIGGSNIEAWSKVTPWGENALWISIHPGFLGLKKVEDP